MIEYQIRLESFSDKTSFFQAQPDFLTITKTPMNRIYSVQINPLLLKYYPGDLAIQAIGVHELFHISDYINMNSTQLLGLGVIYGLIGANHKISTELVINYERKTDERTLALGFSEGLKLYRFWLYKMIALVPGAIEWKQRAYCTPAEIDQFVVNQSCRITNER